MHILRRAVWVALLVGVLVAGWSFAARNDHPRVEVDFWLASTPEAPLWLALVVALAGGAILATAVCLFEVARYSLVARRYRKTVARLEAEIHQLRNLPLADEEALRGAPGARRADLVAPPGGSAASRG